MLALRVFAVGMLVFIAADLTFDHITKHSSYLGGDPVDTLWMLAMIIVCLAAACQLRTTPAGVLAPLPRARAPRRPSLPYLAITSSYLLLAVIGLRTVRFDSLGGGLLVGAVALTFLVSARQYIALHDYGRLAVRYQELASVDGITGLYNRRHFMEAAEAAIAHAQRLGQPIVALMIDVDNFKAINDTHGHITGDQVLAEIAQACREHVRPDDIVGPLRRRRVHHHRPRHHQPARHPARRPAGPAGRPRPRPRRQAARLQHQRRHRRVPARL